MSCSAVVSPGVCEDGPAGAERRASGAVFPNPRTVLLSTCMVGRVAFLCLRRSEKGTKCGQMFFVCWFGRLRAKAEEWHIATEPAAYAVPPLSTFFFFS